MIYVTEHAKERLKKRLGTSKYVKVASKAWNSRIETPPLIRRLYGLKFRQHELTGRILRTFSGLIFVFLEENGKIVLITVINPRELE